VSVSIPLVVKCSTISYLLYFRGNRFRKTEPTAANQVSSRSHAVIQVIVRHTTNQVLSSHEPQTIQVEGKLSLIDLAGSERASATQNRGLRLTEGANINKVCVLVSSWLHFDLFYRYTGIL
jgi:kinesin family protein 18/19